MMILITMMFRVLAAPDRAQCTGRGLGFGQSGTVGCQTRLHRASGLHPGDNDDSDDDDDCIIQDRRRGNPAWSWTHNHKEYPTGKCCFLHTPSCFCLLASLDQNKILENIPPRHNHSLSPGERVVLKETNWLSFCVLYLWSVVMKCIATPSLSYNSLTYTKFMLNSKRQNIRRFFRTYPFFTFRQHSLFCSFRFGKRSHRFSVCQFHFNVPILHKM